MQGLARLTAGVGVVVAALALATGAGARGEHSIAATDDDLFAPDDFSNSVGVDVQWVAEGGTTEEDHNVVQDNRLFSSGDTTTTLSFGPISPSAGTFPYYCEAHGRKGGSSPGEMVGTLRIAPLQVATKAKGPGQQIGVRWAEPSRDTGDRFDVDYRVGPGPWKRWRSDTPKQERAFGKNDNPVQVKPGKTYSFRARSKDSSNPQHRRSDWSPKLVVETEAR